MSKNFNKNKKNKERQELNTSQAQSVLQPPATAEKMEQAIRHFERSVSSLYSGRVSASLIAEIIVEIDKKRIPLNKLALIKPEPPLTLSLTPFNPAHFKVIIKALSLSHLKLNPNDNGQNITLKFPPMTHEQRILSVKQLNSLYNQVLSEIKVLRNKEASFWKSQSKNQTLSEHEADNKIRNLDRQTALVNERIKKLKSQKENNLLVF